MLRALALPARRRLGARAFGSGGVFRIPDIKNEPNLLFLRGSPERVALDRAVKEHRERVVDVPCIVGGNEVFTGNVRQQVMPSDHGHVIARFHLADEAVLQRAMRSALDAKAAWEATPYDQRAAVFLRAADLLSTKWRAPVLAATMLGQGKNIYQAEIDAAAEAIDFWRFNVKYAAEIYADQPTENGARMWNRQEYRPLEGFVAAVTPFNFTAIGANLGTSPAIVGNTTVWKPSDTAMLSNYYIMKILHEAGLPPGIVNFVPADGPLFGRAVTSSRDLGALAFTGSTATFKVLWRSISTNIDSYRTYPRMVGECGGKNFHLVHSSHGDDIDHIVHSTVRSAFEYSGQKCSACSRMYVPDDLWPQIRDRLVEETSRVVVGQPDDPSVLVSAVIDARSFGKIKGYIDRAKASRDVKLIAGGKCDDSKGYFVHPTIFEVSDPQHELLREEIFGPVLSVHVFPKAKYDDITRMIADTSQYALTGAFFARDRYTIMRTANALRHACGNLYINDKSTGSVVGQQPFGGARLSGTNDKAGAAQFMQRFMSALAIKENFVPLSDWRYPYMKE